MPNFTNGTVTSVTLDEYDTLFVSGTARLQVTVGNKPQFETTSGGDLTFGPFGAITYITINATGLGSYSQQPSNNPIPVAMVDVSPAQLAAPTPTQLAITNILYQRNAPPYDIYQSNGTAFVPLGGTGAVQSGALVASTTAAPNATAVQNAIAASGRATISVASGIVIPLDTAGNGKQMAEQTLTVSSTFTYAGQVEGGNCSFSMIGNGSAVPNLSAFVNPGGYVYVATAGARNIYSTVYSYGTPLLYGVAGTPVTPVPVFVSQTAPAGVVGGAYSYTFSALSTTSYSLASGTLPAGITLNTATGAITGTPTVSATSAFVISATGAGGSTNSTAQSVTIAAAATNQRFTTFDNGNIVESGTGPYSYGDLTSGNARAASSSVKFPAGVAASLTYKITVAGATNSLALGLAFDTDRITMLPVAPPIAIEIPTGASYFANGVTSTVAAGIGTFFRLRRDAANTLYAEASPDNVTWSIVSSVAGAAVDYWPKLYMNPTTGGQWTVQSFANSGMI